MRDEQYIQSVQRQDRSSVELLLGPFVRFSTPAIRWEQVLHGWARGFESHCRNELGAYEPRSHFLALMTVIPPIDHGPGLEYLYLAAELSRGLDQHQTAFERYLTEVPTPFTVQAVADPAGVLRQFTDAVQRIIAPVSEILSPKSTEAALGPPGKAGDEAAIRALAARIVAVFTGLLAWAEQLRQTPVPPDWRPVYWELSRYADLPLHQVRNFSTNMSATMERAIAEVRAGKQPTQAISLTLSLSIDPSVEADFKMALAGVSGQSG